jgi:hypothetical protein
MKRKVFLFALFAIFAVVSLTSCYNPWWPEKDFPDEPDFNPGRPLRPSTGNLTVTYHPNTADSGAVPTDPYSYAKGAPVVVLGNDALPPLVKAGYDFAEWSDDPAYDTSGDSLSSGEQFTIENHTNLFAVWLEEDRVIKLNTKKKYTFPQREYGYAPLSPVQMTILNTEPGFTDTLTVRISGRDPNKDYFDIYYTDTSNPMSNNDMIAPIAPNGTFSFWIVPKYGLAVGNYSITIRISNNPDDVANATQRCSFIAGFVVTPHPLTMESGALSYTNTTGSYLTPIASTVPAYTERTATFTVKVKGFKSTGDAAGAGLAFSDPSGAAISYLDFSFTAITAIDGGANYLYTKIFTVTVTFNDTTINGNPLERISIRTTGVSANYYQYSGAQTDVKIMDGQVNTAARLVPVNQVNIRAFNAYANTNTTNYNGLTRHYKQTENITLPPVAAGNSNWTAIGSYPPFTGSYDGNNKTVTGLVIDDTWDSYQGMFGYVENATVKNLGLVNVSITTYGEYAGGLVGYNDNGTLTGIYVTTTSGGTSSITGGNHTGGVVGYNNYSTLDGFYFTSTGGGTASVTGNDFDGENVGGVVGFNDGGTVLNCFFRGSVTGKENVGGIAGNNKGGTVLNCNAAGTVEGNQGNVGGIVGLNGEFNFSTVENCFFMGTLASSIFSAGNNFGGIVGRNGRSEYDDDEYGVVKYCYVTVTININGGSAGGIVGSNGGTVQNCYAQIIKIEATGSNAGGVAGWSGRGGIVQNCYATGGTITGSYYVGGVVGMTNTDSNRTSTVKYCYSTCGLFNTAQSPTVSGLGTTNSIGGIVGLNQGGQYSNNAAITQNNVALSPSLTSTPNNTLGIGRVSGSWPTGTYPAPNFANNYARSDMTIKYNNGSTTYTTITPNGSGKDGADIPGNNWNSETFWRGVFESNSAWEFRNGLPTLKNMPGNPAQNPAVAP